MTRRLIILGAVFCMLLYTVWNFYAEALRYDPMSAVAVKQAIVKKSNEIVPAYSPAWSMEIQAKNLFSPARTSSGTCGASAI